MLSALLLLSLFLAQAEPGPGPTPAQVAETEALLEGAFRSQDSERIQAALRAAQEVPHPTVVKLVVRGLRDGRKEVRLATLQALRWTEHQQALDALHRTFEDREWARDPELMLALLRAIGQHADPRSVPLLVHDPFEPHDHGCWRARIFGLARIRTPDALEGLFTLLGATGGGGAERRVAPVMKDVRIALILLTGADLGLEPERWERWWRQNKKGFRPPEEPPLLPKDLRMEWDRFWGLPPATSREPRREERGREPSPPRTR